jgi:hypothetical protein
MRSRIVARKLRSAIMRSYPRSDPRVIMYPAGENAREVIGYVKNGVVVLEGQPVLAEGTKVRVEPIEIKSHLATLSERLIKVAGTAKGLPADLAVNHDHYLHGQPKR